MRTTTNKTIPSKNILRIVIGTLLILAIPLVAMQFSDEVKWDLRDFIVIGGLLMGAGLVYELIARRLEDKRHRVMLAMVFIALVLTTWAELAVGIFD